MICVDSILLRPPHTGDSVPTLLRTGQHGERPPVAAKGSRGWELQSVDDFQHGQLALVLAWHGRISKMGIAWLEVVGSTDRSFTHPVRRLLVKPSDSAVRYLAQVCEPFGRVILVDAGTDSEVTL